MTNGHISSADMKIESWNGTVDCSRPRRAEGWSASGDHAHPVRREIPRSTHEWLGDRSIEERQPAVQSNRFRNRILVSAVDSMIHFQYCARPVLGWYELQAV
jgi:hypothetical protein